MGGNYDLERVIACDKGGAHRAENVRYVCTIKDCAMKEPLLCEVCRIKWHRDHPVISVNDLLTEVKHRVSAQRLKDYTNIAGTVEEAERVCQESFVNWKKSIASRVSVIESLMQNQFQYLRECEGIFDEHHSRQVIQDIATMQKQSDLGILRNQIKEILPFMTFNQPNRIQGSYSSSKSFSQPITTTLKSLSNKLLGLPPISSTDILSFQQCFLTALQATQNIITQQVSTLKNATKSSLNSTTHMHDLENNHNTNNPNDSFLSQTQGNTTFLNNSLVPQPPKSQQQISAAIPLPKFKLDYSNLYSGEQSSRSQSYQYHASLNQAASKSFITPRGTYKASDLINFYLNPMSDKLQRGYESLNISKRGSFSQWMPSQSSSVKQVLPLYGRTDIAPGQDSQLAAGNVLEDVQRQVDGIQKSLGDLRNSLGGQQSSRGEEGSPSRGINKQNKLRQSSLELTSGQNSVKNQSGILNGFSQQAFTPGGQVITGSYQQQQQKALDFDLSRRNSEAFNSCHNNNNNSNFSDRFQRFREHSRSLSKEKGMNQTYQRYGYEDNNINTSRRASREAQEQTDTKGQQSTSQKRVKFQFSQELHHEFVNVSKYVASGLKDHFQTRLVLLEPTVEIIPHREVSFSFRIKSCKNMEFGQPLALGLCHKNIVEGNNFEFPQKEERIRSSSAAAAATKATTAEISHSPHGCYLLTSSGFLRNHAYQKQDMKKVPVRFTAEDTIICHFNPFRKTLKFTKKSSQESCTLNVDIIPLDKLYPCVRISYAQDSVEYIQE